MSRLTMLGWPTLLVVILGALASPASALASPAYVPGNFEAQCTSAQDYGWPRFESLEDLLAQRSWTSYFQQVYGGLPTKYPLCVYDLWYLDPLAYEVAGLNNSGRPVHDRLNVKEGDLFQGLLGNLGIYHEVWRPLPDYTWVELEHTVYPTEVDSFWAWRTRGSGIWYNTGRTIVFPTPADPAKIHEEAMAFLRDNCTCDISWQWPQVESDVFGCCAREKGYDTIQFEPQSGQVPLGTFGLTGLTEIVIVNMIGNLNCGVEDPEQTHLRAGWQASQTCQCVNEDISPSCGLMAYSPLPAAMTSPPLCQAQAEDPSVACSGYTCTKTYCKL